jgi:dTDP-glucose 4,6-dehydratase
VLGRLDDLAEVSQQTRASVLIVAIADATPALMARVMSMATPLEIDVKIVPTLDKSFGERTRVGQIRDIAIEDLIERQPVKLNIDTIASYLSGRRVLVTGAGGSIGQELCVQIRKFGPQSLVMLDNDETHLQDTEMALWGTGLLMRPEIVLADIRDKENLARLFDQWKPEVVFHAAAYKHVPMLQRYPREAWETNVVGTLNVLECSADVGTEVFVNISTDKAANPTTALGHSKRLAERLTSWMGEQTSKPYCSVRFGNVIGSRGSMVPLVRQMINRGLTITITHEEATRYFMTIPEACQLVVQAGSLGSSGDVMILDMGNPVRVMDIINRLVEISGKDCEIEIIGMREGEKIHEVLVSSEEEGELTDIADRTTRAYVPPISPENLDFEQWIETVVEAREPRGATAKR